MCSPGKSGPVEVAEHLNRPRTREQRRHDTEARLAGDVDLWVASASADSRPYLVPLSFQWEAGTLLMATAVDTPTARNLTAMPTARVGLGETRDVIMIDGGITVREIDEVPRERAERFVRHTGFDPRSQTDTYRWYLLTPDTIQAWREADEVSGRTLMRAGRWL